MSNLSATTGAPPASHWKRYRVLYAVIAVCIAPVAASYLAYYVAPPSGRTNYGKLITPPRPVPTGMSMISLDGQPFSFRPLAGKWVMVSASRADCGEPCEAALLQMRQQRLMTGKERERVERVWLVTDDAPLSTQLLREYEGTHIVRVPAAAVLDLLSPDGATAPDGFVWLIDPMGNLMLRWPQNPEPQKIKNDLARLLTASSHWVRVERKD
jgi:hypothetical protein